MPKRTDISKILIVFSMGIACLTSPSVTRACERSGPLPLEGEFQPYFDTLGPLELFKVRKIEGWLEDRTFIGIDGKVTNQDTPLREAVLTLRNAISGKIVKNVSTDERGHFELTDVLPGSYVLQITQADEPGRNQKIKGNLLIELRTDAKDVHLPLIALSMSDCGMDVHKKNDENSLNQKSESPNAQTN